MITNEPPKNTEVEQQIIGALIKDATHSNSRETIDSLSDDDFYSMSHRLIFNEIKSMSENKENIDLITLFTISQRKQINTAALFTWQT